MVNFKTLEVSGATKAEAMEKAPFEIMGDATQAYTAWRKKQTNAITEADKKQFMIDYLEKKTKCVPGVGFAITLEAAVASTRERPYTVESVKRDGARKWKTVHALIDENGTIVKRCDGTKADAIAEAKELYKNGYRGDLTCNVIKEVVEGSPIAFKIKYTPSKNARIGSYMVFGVERD